MSPSDLNWPSSLIWNKQPILQLEWQPKKVACQDPGDTHTLNGVSPFLPPMYTRPETESNPVPACEGSWLHYTVGKASSAGDTLCCLDQVAKERPSAIPRWREAVSKGYSPRCLRNHRSNHMQESLPLPRFMIVLTWFKGLDRMGWDLHWLAID